MTLALNHTHTHISIPFFSDELLAKVVIGLSSVKETGRAHWGAAMSNSGSRVFMWHEATINN